MREAKVDHLRGQIQRREEEEEANAANFWQVKTMYVVLLDSLL